MHATQVIVQVASAVVAEPSGHRGHGRPLEDLEVLAARVNGWPYSSCARRGDTFDHQRRAASIGVGSSALEQSYGGMESSCGQWLHQSWVVKSILRGSRPWLSGWPMALEMARMCVLAAPMTQAEPKAVASMTGVDKARSSDADGEREVANRQHPQISGVCVSCVLNPVLMCSVERKGVWKPTQRS